MMKTLNPLKRYGQNFLQDKTYLKKISEQISNPDNLPILEIGPGRGALTNYLIQKTSSLSVVEIDQRMTDHLKVKFPDMNIYNTDILKFNFDSIKYEKIIVVGNIPYNITTEIILFLFKNRKKISEILLMVQNETAKRVLFEPPDKNCNKINYIIYTFSLPEYCFKVPAGAFYPVPKVESAIIKFKIKQDYELSLNDLLFFGFLEKAFLNKRKTLKNNLIISGYIDNVKDIGSGILNKRPNELTINELMEIFNFLRQ